tara:strand:+ start:2786 stop:3427 length:642 start_codon:yes stop_codon:yes gene_type:complete
MNLEDLFSSNITVPIIVAFVGFLVAVTTAVIAKEQKISEFRQAWIDGLRCDFAVLITYIRECQYAAYSYRLITLTKKANDDETVLLNRLRFDASKYINLVTLRLNPVKDKDLINEIDNIERLIEATVDINDLKDLEIHNNKVCEKTLMLPDQFHSILKTEWERVKTGEEQFVRFRSIGELCLFAFISAILSSVSIYLLLILVTKFPEYFPGIN